MLKLCSRYWYPIFSILSVVALFVTTTNYADATLANSGVCGNGGSDRCWEGYFTYQSNYGAESQVTTPKRINIGSQPAFSYMFVNSQGYDYNTAGNPYMFIQNGMVWANGYYCGSNVTITSEWTNQAVDPNNLHIQFNCSLTLALNTRYSLAVQYDGNSHKWLWSVNGFGSGALYYREETQNTTGFVSGDRYAFYGETNTPTIQMGGPDSTPGDAVTGESIGYKTTSTGTFSYPTINSPHDYAGQTSTSCNTGAYPCPYNKTYGNFASGWVVYVWTK